MQGKAASRGSADGEDAVPKTKTACINCRRQKMKCRIEGGTSCRRCQRAGVPCIFKARSNAAFYHYLTDLPGDATSPPQMMAALDQSVLQRLDKIESMLGIKIDEQGTLSQLTPTRSPSEDGAIETDQPELRGLWQATKLLRQIHGTTGNPQIWSGDKIRRLWLSFHDCMPGFHFLPNKQRFSSPRPLLLAAMLYTSSSRGPQDLAYLASDYFAVLCSAIAHLSVPDEVLYPQEGENTEEWAFQTVLGIILAGLLSEASIKTTGVWISIAYRLILEYCPPQLDETSLEWKKLFSGLQIVDLEHASLHMSCPVIPIEAPLAKLHISSRDQLYSLSRMMHTGLTHFTGRGLPTIWSYFSGSPGNTLHLTPSFSRVDSAVIRDWARQLDHWLAQFSGSELAADQDQKLVFRQYILHRLLVLSIYLPARGFDLFSQSTTVKERNELLVSARAALKLHIDDGSIWSNFDMVMITWAALIVLQGARAGVGDVDDLQNITIHLEMLRCTNEPEPSFRKRLAAHLESSLEESHIPDMSNVAIGLETADHAFGYPWSIFDEMSLQATSNQFLSLNG